MRHIHTLHTHLTHMSTPHTLTLTPHLPDSPQHKDADGGESEEGRDVAQKGHPGGLYPRTDAEGKGQIGSKEIQHEVNNLQQVREETSNEVITLALKPPATAVGSTYKSRATLF